MRRFLTLLAVVIAVALVAAWLYRGRLTALWPAERTEVVDRAEPATPELGEQADTKLRRLRGGEASEVALSAAEIESLLLYRHAGALPGFVQDPRIGIAADRLRLRARVAIDRLPSLDVLGLAADFLPDTAEIQVEGTLDRLDERRLAFGVHAVEIARIPIPDRIVPGLLERLGRSAEAGLPPDAVAVPLPPGAGAAYVRGDSLVLVARESAGRN